MKISTIEESTKMPFSLVESKALKLEPPVSVIEVAKRGKPWHLMVWRDNESGTFGFYHKNEAVTFEINQISSFCLAYMTRAKGRGWISLEAKTKESKKWIRTLEITSYTQEAMDWLESKIALIEQVTEFEVCVQGCGPDC